MSNNCIQRNRELHRQILDFSRHVAGSAPIKAISLFDYCCPEASHPKGAMEAILVIHDFPARMMSHVKVINGKTIIIIAVDQWIFERDIERGFLGEASAGTLVFPYVAILGEDYLHEQEVLLKKRLILELLQNLRLSFPELSDKICIKPEYFMYEVLLNRVRVFPPLSQCVSSFMQETENEKKPNQTLGGYLEALCQLEKENKVKLSDSYVMIPKKSLSEVEKPKIWLATISKNAPRALFTSFLEVFPQIINQFSQNIETFPRFQSLVQWRKSLDAARSFVDPQEYVFVPTSKGLVSLADRVDIQAFARKMLLKGKTGKIKMQAVGGVLNDVYLIKADVQGGCEQVLVKRFKDWSGFKWFPLNLWSFGTRKFAVLGKSRLEKECAISELLRNEGFNIPKILHVSHNERLIFMEYIEGENLTKAIKRIANSNTTGECAEDLETITRVGMLLAKVHALNVVLGDTKPENVIINPQGGIHLLDFEQASHGGDKTWDVAEFLYFSGHYLPPLHGEKKAEEITNAFINGYVKAGGSSQAVKNAGTSKYTRIFSLFTPPSVLLMMADICKKTETRK